MFLKINILALFLAVCSLGYAQKIKVIDNKGTLRTIEQGIGNVAEAYLATPVVSQVLTNSFSSIGFSGFGIFDLSDFTGSSNMLIIIKPGRYEITYRVSTTAINNETSGGEFYLEVGGTEAPGTRAYTYSRNSLVDKNSVAVTKIIETTTANVTIIVKGRIYASTAAAGVSSLTMTNNGSSLLVKRIK